MKLLFIRHAQSIGNQEKRMQGQTDFALSAEGHSQAERLAQRLLAESWIPTYVYSSPLKRAAQTAAILLNHFQTAPLPAAVSDLIDSADAPPLESGTKPSVCPPIPVEYADELMEFQNGIFAGLTWAEAQQQYPALCQQLGSSLDWIQIPEAEALTTARRRAHQFIQRLLSRHTDSDRLWIVSHSWIMQHLIAELMNCDRSWRIHAKNTALFEFWLDRNRWYAPDENQRFNTELWQIHRFNDCRHLG